MKQIYSLLLMVTIVYLTSCSNSPQDKAQSSVKSYLKENLKNSDSYEPISFTQLDTLKQSDTSDTKLISLYKITHFYTITNADKERVKMSITFSLDEDLKVIEPYTKSINGDYGILTGNVYWKYNDYVGNKADAGALITLYSLDSIRGNVKYETTADVDGDYKFEKVLPGRYFLIVRSKNTTARPTLQISSIVIFADEMKQLFAFDIDKYKNQLAEIDKLDSTYTAILIDDNDKYGGLSNKIDKYETIEEEMIQKSEKLIEMFPDNFKSELGLEYRYSNAFYLYFIIIEEGETENENTDFGITWR